MEEKKGSKYSLNLKPLLISNPQKRQEKTNTDRFFSNKRSHISNQKSLLTENATIFPLTTYRSSLKSLQFFDAKTEAPNTQRDKSTSIHKKSSRFPSVGSNYSDFTIKNNHIFNHHIQTINQHEKKKLNLIAGRTSGSSFHFKGSPFTTNRDSQAGFITQRSLAVEEDEALDLERNRDKWITLGKLEFFYGFVQIKNKESPLKIGTNLKAKY